MRPSIAVAMLACMAAAQVAYAQSCTGHSPLHTVALVELYTSEGCSSCPPADQFLSGLRAAGLGREQVAPLSLHVDYWNYIGWRDPFAQPGFGERQRMLASAANTSLVYTPEFFVNGREVRKWSNSLADVVKRTNARPAGAAIDIAVSRSGPAAVQIVVTGKGPAGSSLQVAVQQNNLDSTVVRGENGGRTLHHDYVARRWFEPARLDASGAVKLTQSFSMPDKRPASDYGVTAFIQSNDGSVLQAYSMPLCGAI